MSRNISFYIIILLIFGSLIWLILNEGEKQNSILPENHKKTESTFNKTNSNNKNVSIQDEDHSVVSNSLNTLKKQISSPLSILLVQIIIIIIFSRILGLTIGKIGQPIVIGEIIAGIILGPSFLGSLFPETFNFIFPKSSLNNLQLFSQFGLVLFMFIIGMEIDTKLVRKKLNSAVIISFTGIIFPYFLGILLSYFIYASFAMPSVNFTTFALFIGIAMSITAFPVLARIIHEKGLTKTPLGIMAITCAATDDITAWLIFAAIIAIAQAGTAISAIVVIAIVFLFLILMLFIIQPILKRIGSVYISSENLSKTVIAIIFLLLFISAFFTEGIGIHALFGAFIAGVVVPKNQIFKKLMINKIEDISTVVLLPLFFAYSGLRTQIGSLNTPYLWGVCGIVILIAIIGKLGGVSIAARIVGNSWRDSISMGILMNTRGLMELIVLNIGYDLGILSPEIFSIMVIMALTTTFMAGPFLNLIDYISKKKDSHLIQANKNILKALISFGNPKMGASLLKLFSYFSGKDASSFNLSALHLTPQTEISRSDAIKYEKNSFIPIKTVANELDIPIKTIYKTTEDVSKEIIKIAKSEKADLLLIGAAKSVFNKNFLGGKVKSIVDQCKCNVGVLIDKDYNELKKVFILADHKSINHFLNIAERLIRNSDARIIFMHNESPEILFNQPSIKELINNVRIEFTEVKPISEKHLENFDLFIINLKYFEKVFSDKNVLIDARPSLLLMNFVDDTFSVRMSHELKNKNDV
jgi:Kef-type K+ transport system membrane component KefB